jgi:hypothetical protein
VCAMRRARAARSRCWCVAEARRACGDRTADMRCRSMAAATSP